MRFVFTLLVASLSFATACHKDGGGGGRNVMVKLTEFKEKMCACKDKACADQVTGEMTRWKSEHKGGDVRKASADDQKKMAAVFGEIGTCMTKIVTDAAMAGPGPAATEGPGAAAGSGQR